MASLATEIPPHLLNPAAKFKVIDWIKAKHLPSRFARLTLEDWGQAVGVTLYPTDYQLVGTVGHT